MSALPGLAGGFEEDRGCEGPGWHPSERRPSASEFRPGRATIRTREAQQPPPASPTRQKSRLVLKKERVARPACRAVLPASYEQISTSHISQRGSRAGNAQAACNSGPPAPLAPPQSTVTVPASAPQEHSTSPSHQTFQEGPLFWFSGGRVQASSPVLGCSKGGVLPAQGKPSGHFSRSSAPLPLFLPLLVLMLAGCPVRYLMSVFALSAMPLAMIADGQHASA